jgi:hypothetical protein
LGFEKVAHFKEVGQKFGKWIDVGYWELLLWKQKKSMWIIKENGSMMLPFF